MWKLSEDELKVIQEKYLEKCPAYNIIIILALIVTMMIIRYCSGLNCTPNPQNEYVETQTSILQKMAVFGDGVLYS